MDKQTQPRKTSLLYTCVGRMRLRLLLTPGELGPLEGDCWRWVEGRKGKIGRKYEHCGDKGKDRAVGSEGKQNWDGVCEWMGVLAEAGGSEGVKCCGLKWPSFQVYYVNGTRSCLSLCVFGHCISCLFEIHSLFSSSITLSLQCFVASLFLLLLFLLLPIFFLFVVTIFLFLFMFFLFFFPSSSFSASFPLYILLVFSSLLRHLFFILFHFKVLFFPSFLQ